jgi:hypothetical protein
MIATEVEFLHADWFAIAREVVMRTFIRPLVAAVSCAFVLILAASSPNGGALAQADQSNQEPVKQMTLTEPQITGFLAAQKDIGAIFAKLPQQATDRPDPKVQAQLDAVAKKYKFASFDEFNNVGENIGLVMAGIDPQTKQYLGADIVIKKQITLLKADKQMPAEEKKQAIDQMNEQLRTITPVQFQENIKLVMKYFDRLVAGMPRPD